MRTHFKAWAEPFINDHPDYSLTDEEVSQLEGFQLEIGSGKGEFLLRMANKFPNELFIGIEKNVTCAGISMKKLVENEISNAKLIYRDGGEIVKIIKDKAVKNIFLNFSDPWPKKRHHKRRLTAASYLANYYRVLKTGGRLVIKTDNTDLFAFTLENLEESPFKLVYKTDDYQDYDEFDTMTEYEQSFREEGVPIHRLILEK